MFVRFAFLVSVFCLMASWSFSQTVYFNLGDLNDTDIVVHPGGQGLTDPLSETQGWVDGGTLPGDFVDGDPYVTQDGSASFYFAPLLSPSLDAMRIDGQSLEVPAGPYESIDLALLSAPGAYGDPFTVIEFLYADGTAQTERFGPFPGWLGNPNAYDNIVYNFNDDSGVVELVSFPTNFGPEEAEYLFYERGTSQSGSARFADGTGFALYLIDVPRDLTEATLGVTVGNNFVISIATDFYDPDESVTEGYTVVANSMDMHGGFEHRALGNLRLYEFDMAPFLADGTGEIFILFTDATPQNGWGPYIQNISLYTGEFRSFSETLAVRVDDSDADVYAIFQTDGGADELPYLYDNSASGPSNRGHRFADGGGSLTYRFELPQDVEDAKLTVDMANNFVVSLAGPTGVVRYAQMTPATPEEANYLVEESGSILGGNNRFADANAYMIYRFDLPNDITQAYAQVNVGNQFIVEAAAGDGDFVVLQDWVAETGQEPRDMSNHDTYSYNLAPFLANNPNNIVRLRFRDGQPADGWGPNLFGISIVNTPDEPDAVFDVALRSMDLFGVDVRNEFNKGYYTFDLSDYLVDNPSNEVFIRFTDGSPQDGWGPGVFWIAVYSGDLQILADALVFDNLKTTAGNPETHGVNLLHRRYLLDPSKQLTGFALPSQPENESDNIHLLSFTLNSASETAVTDWMLQ